MIFRLQSHQLIPRAQMPLATVHSRSTSDSMLFLSSDSISAARATVSLADPFASARRAAAESVFHHQRAAPRAIFAHRLIKFALSA